MQHQSSKRNGSITEKDHFASTIQLLCSYVAKTYKNTSKVLGQVEDEVLIRVANSIN